MSKINFMVAFVINTVFVIHEFIENFAEMIFGSAIRQLSEKA